MLNQCFSNTFGRGPKKRSKNLGGPMLIPNVQVRPRMGPLDRGEGGGEGYKWKKFPSRAKNILWRATAGHFFSSRAKYTYLPLTVNLSRTIFFRPRAILIHGPRAHI